MDKAFTPGDIERRIYERWESSGAFAPRGDGEPYCIMLPPPNVTGTLHMGHAFQHTLMDTLTRWHRMRGHPALWQPGTAHPGIATQMPATYVVDNINSRNVAHGMAAATCMLLPIAALVAIQAFFRWRASRKGRTT